MPDQSFDTQCSMCGPIDFADVTVDKRHAGCGGKVTWEPRKATVATDADLAKSLKDWASTPRYFGDTDKRTGYDMAVRDVLRILIEHGH